MQHNPNKTRIAVVGAGLVGSKHARLVSEAGHLDAIVDPGEESRSLAKDLGTPHYSELGEYLSERQPAGAIIATPNQLHAEQALACLHKDIPVLIEKPISDSTDGARAIVEASAAKAVPVLVGHHRRHNPLVHAARQHMDNGHLGRLVLVGAQFWLYKPDDYFDTKWRREPGAGPIFINLIHDVDLLRFLCGDIVAVTARASNAIRQNAVEDTAVILLEFVSGALGTISLSDTVVAPWSWEFASGENTAYPHAGGACYMFGGTEGSLSLPDLGYWSQKPKRGWWEPIDNQVLARAETDPLKAQLHHFIEVIKGTETSRVSAVEGLKTLAVVEAISTSVRTNMRTVV